MFSKQFQGEKKSCAHCKCLFFKYEISNDYFFKLVIALFIIQFIPLQFSLFPDTIFYKKHVLEISCHVNADDAQAF